MAAIGDSLGKNHGPEPLCFGFFSGADYGLCLPYTGMSVVDVVTGSINHVLGWGNSAQMTLPMSSGLCRLSCYHFQKNVAALPGRDGKKLSVISDIFFFSFCQIGDLRFIYLPVGLFKKNNLF